MNKITLGKLFSLYVDVFDKFGLHLLNETDQMINYYVFEAMEISIGYCSRHILTIFLDEGIIDEDIFEYSVLLLEKFRVLAHVIPIRNAEYIKNSTEWKKLMELSDNIKRMIETKWTNEELQMIFKFEKLVPLALD